MSAICQADLEKVFWMVSNKRKVTLREDSMTVECKSRGTSIHKLLDEICLLEALREVPGKMFCIIFKLQMLDEKGNAVDNTTVSHIARCDTGSSDFDTVIIQKLENIIKLMKCGNVFVLQDVVILRK